MGAVLRDEPADDRFMNTERGFCFFLRFPTPIGRPDMKPEIRRNLQRNVAGVSRYSIDRNTDLERFFNVDALSGVISTAKALDREANSVHNITVFGIESRECVNDKKVLNSTSFGGGCCRDSTELLSDCQGILIPPFRTPALTSASPRAVGARC